ncbi:MULTISPECIES: AMP-binding protein [Methylobacterium]|uniref:Long-chain-fatty-acid--CoA ligase n=1 Tax=Methylobacterium thuringiense TaxID=1003091 RepID=A0ABQ4TP94_9HYPH|nr:MULTISPECIES: fatty acid--CoA ligase family protein [Methylobacterium]TXN21968.1 long-chain fatty acid--CoA ligase [Methylobacterium sp. WL9]GJE56816.1 2-succinylbenzoate--CoA ligase [Methylobacterium thuringiense]
MNLRERLTRAGTPDGLFLADRSGRRLLRDTIDAPGRADIAEQLAGRSVLVATGGQMAAALAMIALDGLVRRMVLAPPGMSTEQVPGVVAAAEIDLCVTDAGCPFRAALEGLPCIEAADAALAAPPDVLQPTEWVLTTSGTTGAPKLVAHTLEGLAGGINTAAAPDPGTVWSTFYDIRRYGGLQVFLRAVLGPSPLVLSDPDEPVREFILRAAAAGVSHILGTPSHWRLAMMSTALPHLSARYVRLSGEIADQTILDLLRGAFPEARIAHAYASTEGGVGFTVEDGREGFPAGLVGTRTGIEIVVRDDTLHIRSNRTGRRYLGEGAAPLADAEAFVDTGDLVERRNDRFFFLGRRSGMINVGGAKVQPEEVETVINGHPRVSMSRVRARPNPILGAVVEAEIVLRSDAADEADPAALKSAIIAHCRPHLAKHKVPVSVKFVPDLPLTAGGKLLRRAP